MATDKPSTDTNENDLVLKRSSSSYGGSRGVAGNPAGNENDNDPKPGNGSNGGNRGGKGGQSSTGGQNESPEKHLLIIFDLDDTIFPTSSFLLIPGMDKALGRGEAVGVPGITMSKLQIHERNVIHVLKHACTLGDVAIATNADEKWMNNVLVRFMPLLDAYLANEKTPVRKISARDKYSIFFPGQPYRWKEAVFLKMLLDAVDIWKAAHDNFAFVSVGDGPDELTASVSLTQWIPGDCIHIVDLDTLKDLDEFIKQFYSVHERLDRAKTSKPDRVLHDLA